MTSGGARRAPGEDAGSEVTTHPAPSAAPPLPPRSRGHRPPLPTPSPPGIVGGRPCAADCLVRYTSTNAEWYLRRLRHLGCPLGAGQPSTLPHRCEAHLVTRFPRTPPVPEFSLGGLVQTALSSVKTALRSKYGRKTRAGPGRYALCPRTVKNIRLQGRHTETCCICIN